MTDVRSYLREWAMPHVLCPGCAHGIVLRAFLEAIGRLELDPDRLAFVAGIGCSSRLVGYVDFCTLHATHGRAPTFATGLKLARPELNVVVITGDGDGLAIGASHLIHAARRNVDLTCLLFNNAIYGMTGGQVAPTTPTGARATTAPFGNAEPPFDACRLLTAAGATFVARIIAFQPLTMTDVLAEGLAHQGFSFIEVMSSCPEYYGRYNQLGDGAEMLAWIARQDAGVAVALADKPFVPHVPASAGIESLPTGVLHREERAVFTGRQEDPPA
jgi:2-oxoglutarate ferredoxin oxidoreductase subunit beta